MQGMMLYTLLLVTGTVLALRVRPRETTLPGSRMAAQNRLYLSVLFWLLFLPAALRVYTGNDYYTYIEHFHDSKLDHYVVTEPGFNLLVKAVYRALGGEYFLVIFAIFSALTVFFFLRGIYEQSCDVTLSFFLFMALSLYFQSYNTVRYYFVLALVFYSLRFVRDREWGKFVLTVLIASLFHKTALAVLLLYPLAAMRWRIWHCVVLAAGGISGIVLRAQYMKLFVWLYPSYVNEEEYLAGGGISLINIARCLLVVGLFAVIWQFAGKELKEKKGTFLYFRMNLLALVMYSCFYYVPFVSRLGYYLNVSQLLLIPQLVYCLKGKKRMMLYGAVLAAGILYFIVFLYRASDDLISILPYRTWLTVPDGMTPVF